jgi:adenosylhomocysteinase
MRAKGLGANVIVTEVKPTAALKAVLDGNRVMSMDEACRIGDIFITATGCKNVIRKEHFKAMKDGAIVCNTGHYDCEVNINELRELSSSDRIIRANCREFVMPDGRSIYLLAEGRLVNLASAEGHPSEVMDMSFANQFQGMMMLAKQGKDLAVEVHEVPKELDQQIASIKLETLGLSIDKLTGEQEAYLDSWAEGT